MTPSEMERAAPPIRQRWWTEAMEPEEDRLLRAFDEELEFSQHGGRVRLLMQSIGVLVCPTGEIIAGDPLYVSSPQDTKPFKQHIPSGTYPVDIVIARYSSHARPNVDERVACARIRINDSKATALSASKPAGYGVDNATGCFMDMVAASVLRRMSESEFDEFWERMRAEEEKVYVPTRSWADLVLDPESGANAIVFSSGVGDGGYPCYYGHDADGKLVSVVTDFGLLITDDDMETAKRRKQWWKFW